MPTISSHPHRARERHDLLEEVQLLDVPEGKQLRLRFTGPFEGNSVQWDATLFTPGAWAAARGEALTTRNIIELGATTAHGIQLQLCLQVECIDLPTVRKAVMLVRQYKRLRRGRHEYG